jgi:hypothetical protein
MLRYIGRGTFLPGIPARNLTDEEAAQMDQKALLASGLYERARPAVARSEVPEVREAAVQSPGPVDVDERGG